MAPFLPQVLNQKGVPEEYNGYIFSTFSAALIVTSPIIGYYLDRLTR